MLVFSGRYNRFVGEGVAIGLEPLEAQIPLFLRHQRFSCWWSARRSAAPKTGAGARGDGGDIQRDHDNPQMLELLEIKGCIVTIGALGRPTKIAAQVVAEGGDDVLGLEGGQGTLHEEG